MVATNKKSLIALVFGIGFFIVLFLFVMTASWIGFGVKDVCRAAQEKYSGDRVEVLIQAMEDESNDLKSRNSAVWALGQLGDERALPHLRKHYKGYKNHSSCDHEKYLCQYELKKAIELIEGGPNITAFGVQTPKVGKDSLEKD